MKPVIEGKYTCDTCDKKIGYEETSGVHLPNRDVDVSLYILCPECVKRYLHELLVVLEL